MTNYIVRAVNWLLNKFRPKPKAIQSRLPCFWDPVDDFEIEEDNARLKLESEQQLAFFVHVFTSQLVISAQQWNGLVDRLPVIQRQAKRTCCFCLAYPDQLGENYIQGNPNFRLCILCLPKLRKNIYLDRTLMRTFNQKRTKTSSNSKSYGRYCSFLTDDLSDEVSTSDNEDCISTMQHLDIYGGEERDPTMNDDQTIDKDSHYEIDLDEPEQPKCLYLNCKYFISEVERFPYCNNHFV